MSKMFNKALIATAVLAASAGLAYANGGTYAPEPVAGPTHNCYVGVAVSRDFAHFGFDTFGSVVTNHYTGQTIVTSHQSDIGNDGWNGEINIGCGGTFQDHYYLAAEIFGDISNVKASTTLSGVAIDNFGNVDAVGLNGSLKLRYEYGITLVPGVKISDSTMLYAKVGFVRGKFRQNLNGFFVANSSPVAVNVAALQFDRAVSNNKTSNGLQLGVGLETMVTNNVSAKIEYNWNRYSNTFGVKHPTVNSAKLGVAYHFMSA